MIIAKILPLISWRSAAASSCNTKGNILIRPLRVIVLRLRCDRQLIRSRRGGRRSRSRGGRRSRSSGCGGCFSACRRSNTERPA